MSDGTLVLVRHGQSEWNAKNLFTGWKDVGLTEKGEAEALAAGKALKAAGIHFDVAFSSVLRRANDTLDIILEEIGQPDLSYTRDQALNERDYGELVGKNKDQARKEFGEEQVHIWRRSYDIPPPGGESLKMTAERTIPYFEEAILPEVKAGKTVMVCAHGNSNRSIVRDLDGLDNEAITRLELATGVPLVYTITADGTVTSKKELPIDACAANTRTPSSGPSGHLLPHGAGLSHLSEGIE